MPVIQPLHARRRLTIFAQHRASFEVSLVEHYFRNFIAVTRSEELLRAQLVGTEVLRQCALKGVPFIDSWDLGGNSIDMKS